MVSADTQGPGNHGNGVKPCENSRVPRRKPGGDAPEAVQHLRHVLVVGGSLADWDALDASRWAALRSELANSAAAHGAVWLTIRPYSATTTADACWVQRCIDVRENCTVTVDPCPDGRDRFLAAIDQLRDAGVAVVDEAAIAGVLMAPAPCEPDLTLILGPFTHLPESLGWDLAYSELVFAEVPWAQLGAEHIELAVAEYSRRHRRFGGIE